MSQYIPSTPEQKKEMLESMGISSVEDLFAGIPREVRLGRELELPEALDETALYKHLRELAAANVSTIDHVCFLGAGAYDHYIPSVVDHILSRSEFYTSYTPYQPEISQGTLQAIFEYQSMICELTGMDVSNASLYDGATAVAEAAAMACRATSRAKVLISDTVNPQYSNVLSTYTRFNGIELIKIASEDGSTYLRELEKAIDESIAAVIVQSPNFFGIIEQLDKAAELAHKHGALLIAVADPISLGLLKSPGELGADIVCGEGQALGNPLSFGGPYLGFFAAKQALVRRMPGRICGETVDKDGRRGFVLTIQTREQHIRREKAMSNICSNQTLNAIAAAVYLSVLGKQGLRQVAELCVNKAHYAYDRLISTGLFEPVFRGPFFKEFAVKSPVSIEKLNHGLLEAGMIGGYDLGRDYPGLDRGWLLAVTEKRTREEIDRLVERVVEICHG